MVTEACKCAAKTTDRFGIVVVGSGWRFASGISYYTWHLVTALHEHGHRSAVLLMRNLLPTRLYPGGCRVGAPMSRQSYGRDVPVFDGVDWWALPSLVRAVRFIHQQRPELVVLQWWTATVLHSYLVLVLSARFCGAKVVIEFHEVLDSAELRRPIVKHYAQWLSRPILRLASGAIVHSRYDRELVIRTYGLSGLPCGIAPHGPFTYLSGGPGSGREPPIASQRDDDVVNLLFFGTIRPYKGLEHLVEAFDMLSVEEVAGYRLTVVGETWEGWTRPADLIAASRFRERIIFVNRYVDDDEAAAFFGSADAVVLPYLRSSASGPLHLAMAHGLPVAVTEVGGLTEAAREYDGAVVVPAADPGALVRALRKLRGMRGRRFPDPHSWAATVRAVEDLATQMGLALPRSIDEAVASPIARRKG